MNEINRNYVCVCVCAQRVMPQATPWHRRTQHNGKQKQQPPKPTKHLLLLLLLLSPLPPPSTYTGLWAGTHRFYSLLFCITLTTLVNLCASFCILIVIVDASHPTALCPSFGIANYLTEHSGPQSTPVKYSGESYSHIDLYSYVTATHFTLFDTLHCTFGLSMLCFLFSLCLIFI